MVIATMGVLVTSLKENAYAKKITLDQLVNVSLYSRSIYPFRVLVNETKHNFS